MIRAPNLLLAPQLRKLNDALKTKEPYEVVSVDEYTPADRKKRYRFIQKGLCKCCFLCTYSVGGLASNYHFMWLPSNKVTLEASLHENQKIIDKTKADVPTNHNRALRKHLISQFGHVSKQSNLAFLR